MFFSSTAMTRFLRFRIGGSIFGSRFELLEVVQACETVGAQVNAQHVEHFTRGNREFPADDPILGLRVALDFDLFDVGRLAFLDLINQIHRAGVHVCVLASEDPRVDVPARSVESLDRIDIL